MAKRKDDRKYKSIKIGIVAALIIVAINALVFFTLKSIFNNKEQNSEVSKENLSSQSISTLSSQSASPSASQSQGSSPSLSPEIEVTDDITKTPETATAPFEKDGIIVVNKKHPLPKNYSPGENSEAVSALKELIAAAQKSGDEYASKIQNGYSGFRSFEMQKGLYSSYVAKNGAAAADTFSARPGYSEHQTGLAFDLMMNGNLYRISDKNYDFNSDWVAKHCVEFGFIIRYRDEWKEVTGYVAEPWHLRYLGKDMAKKVSESGKTLEEFLGIQGGDY